MSETIFTYAAMDLSNLSHKNVPSPAPILRYPNSDIDAGRKRFDFGVVDPHHGMPNRDERAAIRAAEAAAAEEKRRNDIRQAMSGVDASTRRLLQSKLDKPSDEWAALGFKK